MGRDREKKIINKGFIKNVLVAKWLKKKKSLSNYKKRPQGNKT